MSCFFCPSNEHVSHNCDTFNSNEDRRKILRSKDCCRKCLTQHDSYCVSCKSCKTFQKCYICFSKSHHTVFCPDRFYLPNIFLPNIDKDLLSRFLQFLTPDERYFAFLSLSFEPNFIHIQPFKIKFAKKISISSDTSFADFDFIVTDRACVDNADPDYFNTAKDSIPLNLWNISFRIRYLEIRHLPFSSDEFLHLLSAKTICLKCDAIEFLPKLTIGDIVKKAPNLEYIEVHLTNVEINASWPDDVMQHSRATKLRQIYLSIPDLNFNVESLATLIKNKSSAIYFYLNQEEHYKEKKAFQKVTKKLLNHFTLNTDSVQSTSVLDVRITDPSGCNGSKQYVLKDA